MSILLNSVNAPIILELIQQSLPDVEQQLSEQLMSQLEKPPLSLEQKHKLIDKLCGAWADDDSIPAIFQEIEAERALSRSREISFDKQNLRNTNSNGIT